MDNLTQIIKHCHFCRGNKPFFDSFSCCFCFTFLLEIYRSSKKYFPWSTQVLRRQRFIIRISIKRYVTLFMPSKIDCSFLSGSKKGRSTQYFPDAFKIRPFIMLSSWALAKAWTSIPTISPSMSSLFRSRCWNVLNDLTQNFNSYQNFDNTVSDLNVKHFNVVCFVDGKYNEKRNMTKKENKEKSSKFHSRERCITRW